VVLVAENQRCGESRRFKDLEEKEKRHCEREKKRPEADP